MYSFSRYKEQYRANLKLALPVVLSQVGQILVQFADNAMVNITAIYTKYSSRTGGFITYQLLVSSYKDIEEL